MPDVRSPERKQAKTGDDPMERLTAIRSDFNTFMSSSLKDELFFLARSCCLGRDGVLHRYPSLGCVLAACREVEVNRAHRVSPSDRMLDDVLRARQVLATE
jgi:hypothetical protein